MTVVSLDMAYRSFRGGSGRLRHPPRYAAYLTPSSPSFPHSSPLASGFLLPTVGNDTQKNPARETRPRGAKFKSTHWERTAFGLPLRGEAPAHPVRLPQPSPYPLISAWDRKGIAKPSSLVPVDNLEMSPRCRPRSGPPRMLSRGHPGMCSARRCGGCRSLAPRAFRGGGI